MRFSAWAPSHHGDEQSFGMYIAGRLNFLKAQASVALDPGAAPEDRAYASSEISDTLARLPMPSLIGHLTSLAAATLGKAARRTTRRVAGSLTTGFRKILGRNSGKWWRIGTAVFVAGVRGPPRGRPR